jgi:hypothetical protein
MKSPDPKRLAILVPFSEDDQHPIQAVTLKAAIDALDDACQFRQLDSKDWALSKLRRTA